VTSTVARLPISVVVPARNAGDFIEACLAAVLRNRPAEIIVVDGRSEDDTVEIARRYADSVLSDEGGGVAYARQMGAEAAEQPYVAFVDVDIELTDTALADLFTELKDRKLEAIQAVAERRREGLLEPSPRFTSPRRPQQALVRPGRQPVPA